jgi:serine/threonine protein kinase
MTQGLTPLAAANALLDIAHALHYLHDFLDVPIVHADLRPRNVAVREFGQPTANGPAFEVRRCCYYCYYNYYYYCYYYY